MSENHKTYIKKAVGEKLLEVKGLIYYFDKPDFEHPQQLQLVFSNLDGVVSFRCDKHGSTLELTGYPIQEADLGEYGKEVIIDISNSKFFSNYIGRVLLAVYSVFSSIDDACIGIKLVFDGALSLIVVNIGDEINIFDYLLSSFESEEGVKYQLL
ncbi:hypothetical protein [Dickeya oryzae]